MKTKPLHKRDFSQWLGGPHYFHRFIVKGQEYEIALEATGRGFDVGLYKIAPNREQYLTFAKQSTNHPMMYELDPFNETERRVVTWERALAIARALKESVTDIDHVSDPIMGSKGPEVIL